MRTKWISTVVILALAGVGVAAPAQASPQAGCAAPQVGALSEFFSAGAPTAPGGTVVSVVADGRTILTQGYGALDPQRSLMRIASISKLFTWTAVMQQVEAGRLDLHADVNSYLKDFKIPKTYPQPITLLDLMDHTAGFEERTIGIAARDARDVQPLAEFLAANMPARIRPPGEVSAYSNYGAALAGYIVAQVSGEPWDQYVQRHELDPLGMTHSTATEPVPAALVGDLAASYSGAEKVPFTFDQLSPDGAVSATAADMAKFMAAQLNDGRGLLSPATTALMHQRSYAADPRLGGYAHGFMERMINGHQVLLHDGGWEAFGSLLVLVPDCHLGVFVSSNTDEGTASLAQRMPEFYDTFLPVVTAPAVTAPATAAPEPGFYQPTRHVESTVEKLITLLGPSRLTVDADGTVHFKGKEWGSQGDGFYRASGGSDHLVARGSYVATDGPVYQKLGAADTLTANLVVLVAVALLGLTGLIALVVAIFRRRPMTQWRGARLLAALASALSLIFLVLLLVVLLGDTSDFLYGVPLSFRLLLALPVTALLAGLAALALTVRSWRDRDGSGLIVRVHQVTLLAGLGAFTWFALQWNLVGWHLG